MLGYKDAAMTLNVYAGLFEDDLDELTDRQDAVWRAANTDTPRTDAHPRVVPMSSRRAETGP